MIDNSDGMSAASDPQHGSNDSYARGSTLGKCVDADSVYNPDLLFAIPRVDYRKTIEFHGINPIDASVLGVDLWHCYEISWLNQQGLPQVACARIEVAASSEFIFESKSLKLYLNSLNSCHVESVSALELLLSRDLSSIVGEPVQIACYQVGYLVGDLANESQESPEALSTSRDSIFLDELPVSCSQYEPQASLLELGSIEVESISLHSHLLRSNCPITNQPDWASLRINYSGTEIVPASLLRYIVSYRNHNGFHEQCIEQIYADIMALCEPKKLSIMGQYTRRGGIDINPYRSNYNPRPAYIRVSRQ